MKNEELWDYMSQEVREYMAIRYYQTTRCCLSKEQIADICSSEILFIERRHKTKL